MHQEQMDAEENQADLQTVSYASTARNAWSGSRRTPRATTSALVGLLTGHWLFGPVQQMYADVCTVLKVLAQSPFFQSRANSRCTNRAAAEHPQMRGIFSLGHR